MTVNIVKCNGKLNGTLLQHVSNVLIDCIYDRSQYGLVAIISCLQRPWNKQASKIQNILILKTKYWYTLFLVKYMFISHGIARLTILITTIRGENQGYINN
jgi:hypothetical protein